MLGEVAAICAVLLIGVARLAGIGLAFLAERAIGA
jgi:hypothetical protein